MSGTGFVIFSTAAYYTSTRSCSSLSAIMPVPICKGVVYKRVVRILSAPASMRADKC